MDFVEIELIDQRIIYINIRNIVSIFKYQGQTMINCVDNVSFAVAGEPDDIMIAIDSVYFDKLKTERRIND